MDQHVLERLHLIGQVAVYSGGNVFVERIFDDKRENFGLFSHHFCEFLGTLDRLSCSRTKIADQAGELVERFRQASDLSVSNFGDTHLGYYFASKIKVKVQIVSENKVVKRFPITVELFLEYLPG